jgi:anti-anti-sigma factor
MGQALTIEVRHEQGYVIVTAAGEIHIFIVTWLRERLFELAASGCPLVVDLSQVSFIDSVGLAALAGMASGPPRVAAACTRLATGRRSASCFARPGWNAGYRWPALAQGPGGPGGSPDHSRLRRGR